jgi:hypothetical protein
MLLTRAHSLHIPQSREISQIVHKLQRETYFLFWGFFFFSWIFFVQRPLQLPATSVSIRFEVSENKAMAKSLHVLLGELLYDDTCARDAARSSVLEIPVVS